MVAELPAKPVVWVGSSRKDLRGFRIPFRTMWATPCTSRSAAADTETRNR
jgi:hypothetical protein